jgi:hypothetical protein
MDDEIGLPHFPGEGARAPGGQAPLGEKGLSSPADSGRRRFLVSGPHGAGTLVDQDFVRQRIILGQDACFERIALVFDLPQMQVGISGGL